jgi:hypothetical protein
VNEIEGAEAPEQETTCVCPNCGATLKIEVEQPEAAPAPAEGPSIRDALQGAMG